MLAGCATDTAKSTDDRLARAETTIANFQKDPEMTWFRDNVGRARAVVIAPDVTRAGFIIGGSGGEALVLARDKASGQWAGPAFYNMGTASVGLLAGVDVSEIVILVMTEKAVDGLLSTDFKVGGDASVAAGPVGVGAKGTVSTDMVAFSRAKGVFGGLALDGAVIKPDMGANAAYYGTPASPADILVRHAVNNPSSAALQKAVSMSAQ
jgi:lipid-binding SYLF domain-containing protein